MLSLITQNEIKAKDKTRKAIPQRQYPCMAGNGEEEVAQQTGGVHRRQLGVGEREIPSPAENWPKLQFKIPGNINQCI